MEDLFEDGIVEQVKDGVATIKIKETGACEECSAKIFCKPSDSNDRKLIAKNKLGANPGDFVRLSLPGKNLVKASILLYGIPLLIIILSVLIGLNLFSYLPELFSTITGILLIAFYYLVVFSFSKRKDDSFMPEIISIKRRK